MSADNELPSFPMLLAAVRKIVPVSQEAFHEDLSRIGRSLRFAHPQVWDRLWDQLEQACVVHTEKLDDEPWIQELSAVMTGQKDCLY